MCVSGVNPPHSVSVSDIGTENVTVCWKHLRDEDVDAHHVQLWPHLPSQERSRVFWVNNSDCITLMTLVPGETYDVGVAAERGGNRSLEKTIQLTLSTNRQFLSVSIYTVALYCCALKAMHVVCYAFRAADGPRRCPLCCGHKLGGPVCADAHKRCL